MRTHNLNLGLEQISRQHATQEVHLPKADGLAPAYAPDAGQLSQILNPPTLDQSLIELMKPSTVQEDLLQAAVLSTARRETQSFFQETPRDHAYADRKVLHEAARILTEDIEHDEAIWQDLAIVLKG